MAPEVRTFGAYRFVPATGELFRGDQRVELQNQPARVLDLLTRRPGDLVTRDEIRETIWGGATHVDFDRGLNFCIRRIRLALEDSSRSPVFLETLPRRGYRFRATVTVSRKPIEAARSRRPGRVALGVAFALGLLGGATLAEDFASSTLHRRMIDWLHQRVVTPGEPCPWAGRS